MSQYVSRSFASFVPTVPSITAPGDPSPHRFFSSHRKPRPVFFHASQKPSQTFHPLPYKTPILSSFPSIYDANQIISNIFVTKSFHKEQFNQIFSFFPYTTINFQILSSKRGGQGLILQASRYARHVSSNFATGAGAAASETRVPARLRARHRLVTCTQFASG